MLVARHITDRYIAGTTLRLRGQAEHGGTAILKLTQKIPMRGSAAQQGFITTMYLGEDEFEVLAHLRAKQLTKTRYSVPPFGIDVFEGDLEGLLLAEAEFDSAADAESLTLPAFVFREVSDDDRFTGGQLVGTSRKQVRALLLEYGIKLTSA